MKKILFLSFFVLILLSGNINAHDVPEENGNEITSFGFLDNVFSFFKNLFGRGTVGTSLECSYSDRGSCESNGCDWYSSACHNPPDGTTPTTQAQARTTSTTQIQAPTTTIPTTTTTTLSPTFCDDSYNTKDTCVVDLRCSWAYIFDANRQIIGGSCIKKGTSLTTTSTTTPTLTCEETCQNVQDSTGFICAGSVPGQCGGGVYSTFTEESNGVCPTTTDNCFCKFQETCEFGCGLVGCATTTTTTQIVCSDYSYFRGACESRGCTYHTDYDANGVALSRTCIDTPETTTTTPTTIPVPGCPQISPPSPDFCSGGQVAVPETSGSGCITGYICQDDTTTTSTTSETTTTSTSTTTIPVEFISDVVRSGEQRDLQDLSETRFLRLEQATEISFDVQNERHQIFVKNIGTDSALIEISSDPFDVTINVGETKQVDSNGDGVNDLEITLHSINGFEMDITFKNIAPIETTTTSTTIPSIPTSSTTTSSSTTFPGVTPSVQSLTVPTNFKITEYKGYILLEWDDSTSSRIGTAAVTEIYSSNTLTGFGIFDSIGDFFSGLFGRKKVGSKVIIGDTEIPVFYSIERKTIGEGGFDVLIDINSVDSCGQGRCGLQDTKVEEGKKYAYRIRAKTVFEGKTSYSNYLEPIGDNVFSPSLEYSVTASTIYDPNFPEQPTVQGELSEPGQPSQPSEQPSSSSVGDGGSGTSAGGRRDYGRSYPDVEDYGDTDNDGLPDNWEIENFVGLSQGADDDYDNDGFNNLNEYRTRSDPRASEDYGEDDSSNIAYFIIIGVVVFGVLGFFTFRKLHHKKPVMQNLETNGHAQQNVQENIPQGNQESPLQGLGESKHQGNQQEHLQHQEPQQESPIQGLGNIQQEHPQQNVEPHENSAQVSPELKDYITKMRKTGYKDQDIKNSLLEAGWDAHDVDNALKTVK